MSLKCLLGLRTVWIWFSVGPHSSSTTFSKINKTPRMFKDFLDTGRHAGKMRKIQKERIREGNAAKNLACLDFKLGNRWFWIMWSENVSELDQMEQKFIVNLLYVIVIDTLCYRQPLVAGYFFLLYEFYCHWWTYLTVLFCIGVFSV